MCLNFLGLFKITFFRIIFIIPFSFSGPNPSPNTRKFFKKQCDDLGRFHGVPDEEVLQKRAKLDESFIASTNPAVTSKKTPKSSVSTPTIQVSPFFTVSFDQRS